MARRKRGRSKLPGIVAIIVTLVVGFTVLTTAHERYDLGLPALDLTSIGQALGFNGGEPPSAVPLPEGNLAVHFIDVGQGDSALIIAPERTVLIDGGDNGQGPNVLRYLAEQGVSEIDIMIVSHPHADHIGGLIDVVNALPVGEVIMPELSEEVTPTTRTYENFLTALLENDLSITVAVPGQMHYLGGGARLSILAPLREYTSVNDSGVVARLEFGETSFLFTGDIERAAENDLAIRGGIRSNVLSVSHHGSRTSTTQIFLDAVAPNIAVISCGLDNSYGHPHRYVIQRLEEAGVHILRTDFDGSIVLVSDGSSIGIMTER